MPTIDKQKSAALIREARDLGLIREPVDEQAELKELGHLAYLRFMSYENRAHSTNADELLELSDTMADVPNKYAKLAASARLEYIARNEDPQAFDHLEIAGALLLESMEHNLRKPESFFKSALLYESAPLFILIKNGGQMTSNQRADSVKVVRERLLGLVEDIDECARKSKLSEKDYGRIKGIATEALILAALTYPSITERGEVALPALLWQDLDNTHQARKFETGQTRSYGSFDIGVHSVGDAVLTRKIQVKSARNPDAAAYDDDIVMLYAKDLTFEFRDGVRHASPDLYRRFVGLTKKERTERCYKLHKLVIDKLPQARLEQAI